MSNPAVIKLQSGSVGKSKVWLDDNFGESIHIHIDDYRVDLTVEEFRKLYEDLCLAINELVDVEGFDAGRIDPVYFSVMLWPRLHDLTGVSMDTVSLGRMLAPVQSKIVPLPESMGVKALQGLSSENNAIARKSNHVGQDDNERMAAILESIKKNGYPYEGRYIILYGDDMIIRDGQHRASCLYYLYGDVEVPVLRLHFKHYKSPKIDKNYNHKMRVFFRRHLLPTAKSTAKKARSQVLRIKRRLGRSVKRRQDAVTFPEELVRMFDAK